MITAATPGYWRNETTGVLRPVVLRYLKGHELRPSDCAALRAYIRQWITSPVWDLNPHGGHETLAGLRSRLDDLTSRQAIEAWLDDATELGLDPL